jgi:AraC-like DNA-binding protein
LGYASASAFVYMFRNLMGVPPTRYLEQIAGGPR